MREVRLIDENGEQVGIITTRDALDMAHDRDLDLVEVAPNASPPVCRLMDYGKYRYEQTKKEREARKNQKQVELKEIRMQPRTDTHDLQVKVNNARRFLEEGHKVKFSVRFRGREITHPEIGRDMLEQIAEDLRDHGVLEQKPTLEGRAYSLIMAPSPSKTQQPAKRSDKPAPPSPSLGDIDFDAEDEDQQAG
ncbi:translation initiation factor IF-3 [Herpetosiphon sp. NSE202]|uniref:translation initiation factor IF-3 n=1 Tax=Herpetosiphon sp. NSE202 TaxID=3351349 RepID=UPI00362EA3BD